MKTREQDRAASPDESLEGTSPPAFDDLDRELMNHIQEEFPLAPEPYREIGERLGISETDVMDRMKRLKAKGIIRQTSAIFDTRALGYKSSLIAMEVGKERADEAAMVLNAHPGISHNYLRNHRFNLWFTLAVPPYRDLEEEKDRLAGKAGAIRTWLLPNLELYKIGVSLDMTGRKDVTRKDTDFGQRDLQTGDDIRLDDVRAIRELQKDLPVDDPQPFRTESRALGISEDQLFDKAEDLRVRRKMRRFASILHHRKAGFKANPMAVWAVPPEKATETGRMMASFAAVSHCYRRPTYPDWPYSHYTMIHGRGASECREVAEAISRETGITDYLLLYSTKEYKKTRVEYFTEDDWPEGYFT